MATKNNFSSADWQTLRDTPYLVGFATVLAGSSGLATVKELVALSQGILQGKTNNIELIRELTATSEMEAAQTSLKQSFEGTAGKPSPENVRHRALEQVRASMAVLEKTGSKENADAYRGMLYEIAEKVANAAREGGFLGFGGAQVSEGERSFLNELQRTLELEHV